MTFAPPPLHAAKAATANTSTTVNRIKCFRDVIVFSFPKMSRCFQRTRTAFTPYGFLFGLRPHLLLLNCEWCRHHYDVGGIAQIASCCEMSFGIPKQVTGNFCIYNHVIADMVGDTDIYLSRKESFYSIIGWCKSHVKFCAEVSSQSGVIDCGFPEKEPSYRKARGERSDQYSYCGGKYSIKSCFFLSLRPPRSRRWISSR